MNYPYSLLPFRFSQYEKNIFPELEAKPYPLKPKLSLTFKQYPLGLLILGIVYLSVFYGEGWDYEFPILFLVVLIGGPTLFGLFFVGSNILTNSTEYEYFRKAKYEYEKLIKEIDMENERRKGTKNRLSNQKYKAIYIEEQKPKILASFNFNDLEYFTPKSNFSKYSTGASEYFFARILYTIFENYICTYCVLKEERYAYEPDFVYIEDDLVIDIEIDEPYTIIDGKATPIHCMDEAKDKNRDEWFTMANWCVIRFAESQVLEEPFECCRYIANFIYKQTGNDEYLKHPLLENKELPKTISRWNKSKALGFAREKARLTAFKNSKKLYPNFHSYPEKHLLTVGEFCTTIPHLEGSNKYSGFYSCYDSSGYLKDYSYIYLSSEFASEEMVSEIVALDLSQYKTEILEIPSIDFFDDGLEITTKILFVKS